MNQPTDADTWVDWDRSAPLDDAGVPGYVAVVAVSTGGEERLALVLRDDLDRPVPCFPVDSRAFAPHELVGRLPKPYAPACGRRACSGRPCRVRVPSWGDACPRHADADPTPAPAAAAPAGSRADGDWARALLRRVGPDRAAAVCRALADVLRPGDEDLLRELCRAYGDCLGRAPPAGAWSREPRRGGQGGRAGPGARRARAAAGLAAPRPVARPVARPGTRRRGPRARGRRRRPAPCRAGPRRQPNARPQRGRSPARPARKDAAAGEGRRGRRGRTGAATARRLSMAVCSHRG